MEAIANPPACQRARAAVRFDEVARTLVHALKYQDRTDLAPAMGRWMARAGREMLEAADLLIPVPLHWRRAWHRRYNQSGALARVVERQCGVKLKGELLRHVRATEQQFGLSRPQRASNVQGAFEVSADQRFEIQGRRWS
jgi:predicted amidophosphoribosyltransferase